MIPSIQFGKAQIDLSAMDVKLPLVQGVSPAADFKRRLEDELGYLYAETVLNLVPNTVRIDARQTDDNGEEFEIRAHIQGDPNPVVISNIYREEMDIDKIESRCLGLEGYLESQFPDKRLDQISILRAIPLVEQYINAKIRASGLHARGTVTDILEGLIRLTRQLGNENLPSA